MKNSDLMTTEVPLTLPDGTTLSVEKLSVTGERKLYLDLGRKLVESYGPGSYLANAKETLTWMEENKMFSAYQQLVSELGRMVATKSPPTFEAIDAYRQTPDGLSWELYYRTRKTHKDLSQGVIRSQINSELIAFDLFQKMIEAFASSPKS